MHSHGSTAHDDVRQTHRDAAATDTRRRRIARAVIRAGLAAGLGLGLVAWGTRPSAASTAFGDLNNFDVFNDTGQECHGFEIELDDVRSTDITYTYDWNHYGPPMITEDNGDPAHPKVFVRYAASYASGAFSAFTAVPATAPSPTDGHMCTDPTVNFGCEHFGVGYYGTPSAVRYHWLIEDPFAPGTLIQGPAVNVATPNWTYYPPAPARPVAQVQAVILAPPPPPAPASEFGDAVWVKSIVTTSHNNAPIELKDLVSDDPDDPNDKNWANGEPAEIEIEWQILQTEFNNPNGPNNELAGEAEGLPNGDEVVTRRYEFYKYAGPLDPETNEAKCDKYPPVTDPANPRYKSECDASILGDYIGAQMAGFNVEAALGLIDHVLDGELGVPYTPRTVVVGGNTPYMTTVGPGALPPGLEIDSSTGVLSGVPAAAGEFSFTVTAVDADLVQVSTSFTMRVAGAPDACTDVICTALDACHEPGVCDPATGQCSDPIAPDGSACDDGDACTQTDTCVAGACNGSNSIVCAPSDTCHVAGTCDPSTGACSNPLAPDGTACSDGNACTTHDTCVAGSCTAGSPDPACSSADLGLRLRASLKRGKQGRVVELVTVVRNLGPNDATSASLELICTGVPHHVEATAGCVVGAGSTTCDLGTLKPASRTRLTIAIVPVGTGLLTCAGRVSSLTPDPNPANQSASAAVRVR